MLYVDALGSSVMFRVVSKCDDTLAVGVDDVLVADIVAEFLEETVNPNLFLQIMGKCYVFRFRSREGNIILFLRAPRYGSSCNAKTNPETDFLP